MSVDNLDAVWAMEGSGLRARRQASRYALVSLTEVTESRALPGATTSAQKAELIALT